MMEDSCVLLKRKINYAKFFIILRGRNMSLINNIQNRPYSQNQISDYQGNKVIRTGLSNCEFVQRIALFSVVVFFSCGLALLSSKIQKLWNELKERNKITFLSKEEIEAKKEIQNADKVGKKHLINDPQVDKEEPILKSNSSKKTEETVNPSLKTKDSHDFKSASDPNEITEKKGPNIRPLPQVPKGVIQNGYGEYLIYRLSLEGKKEAISVEEYEKIYDLIEECRALKGDQIPENRHLYLKEKIQEKLGQEVLLAFIPRTLYELIFVKECIQEDIDNGTPLNVHEFGILSFSQKKEFEVQTKNMFGSLKMAPEEEEKIVKETLKQGFWQVCLFTDKDYELNFIPKYNVEYRYDHVKKIAARLNQVAIEYFKEHHSNPEGFNFQEITTTKDKLVNFYKELHSAHSELNAKAKKVISSTAYVGVAKEFAEEEVKIHGKADPFPKGIADERHENIIASAIQLECSQESVNHIILYRGAKFSEDALMKKDFFGKSLLGNSLSYGPGLFSGVLFDGGANPFHYMRKPWLDALALTVPIKKQYEGKTPFHIYHINPLIQMMSSGEFFHGRTKVWNHKPKDRIEGFYGGSIEYSRILDCCKTERPQAKIEKQFKKYKDKTYILASKKQVNN